MRAAPRQAAAPLLDQAWLPGLVAIAAAVSALAMYRSMQSLEAPQPIVLIAAVVAIGAALVDMGGLVLGPGTMNGAHALSWAGPLLLFAMGTPLVEHFIDGLREAGIELAWDARNLPESIGLHPDAVLPILRIVQEALNNALKHSGARVARVTFDTSRIGDAEYLDIRIADNGRGMSAEGVGGRGLLNMRNRSLRIGAQLNIVSAPGSGTVVHLRCKLD